MINKILEIDEIVFKMINVHDPIPVVDSIMFLFSQYYFYVLIIAGLLFWTLRKRHYPLLGIIIIATLAVSLTDLINYHWLKQFFAKYRPCVDHAQIARILDGCAGRWGFPSNHAANSMAIVSVFFYFKEYRWGLFALSLSFLIGFSRIYLGAHYPLDVLGGYVCGGVLGVVVSYITKPIYYAFKNRHQY